ncbi:MAG: XRE family transcriptional regulator [Chloroflexota bacterium]|nr:XRE family transcriptional regulator [Chloroflexota bacterium]
MNIGYRVRNRRKEQGLSLRALASRSGLSLSFLSQMERDLVRPSISSLKQVADALDVKVGVLLADPAQRHPTVLRRDERPAWQLSRVRYELLTTVQGQTMEPQLVTYEAGADSGDHPVTHEGEEFGMVLQGCAECWIGEELLVLKEGDCVYFDASVPHRMRNAGDEPCVWLHVVTPPSF